MELTDNERAWKVHLDAAAAAGQTLANYARQHELDVSKLYGYRGTINRKVKKHEAALSSFVRVEAEPRPRLREVRIELPNGIRLIVASGDDLPQLISNLVQLP